MKIRKHTISKLHQFKQWILHIVISSFKHDCHSNGVVITESFLKDGDTGMVISLGKDFKCSKCGSKWSR